MRHRRFGDSGENGVESYGAGYPSHGAFFAHSFKNLRNLHEALIQKNFTESKTTSFSKVSAPNETTRFSNGLTEPFK